MEGREQGYPGEFGRKSQDQDVEQRFGEEAYTFSSGPDPKAKRSRHEDGMATSSATVGTGTAASSDSAYGSPTEGTQQSGGIGSADHGPEGTVNTGSGAGRSSGNATGGATTGDDAHTTMPTKQQS
jgi:hypothetical protein